MSTPKKNPEEINLDFLIPALRAEVGEIITTWVVMKHFMKEASLLRSGNLEKDLQNNDLGFIDWLVDKFGDEIVARLSELAGKEDRRLNFAYTARCLHMFHKESRSYYSLIIAGNFARKRNVSISHKVLPKRPFKSNYVPVSYPVLLRALAAAMALMKKVDREVYGPAAPYFWREARKRRHSPMYPVKVNYSLLHYVRLSNSDRIKILAEELNEGYSCLDDMTTTINGKVQTVKASKKWGIIFIGGRPIFTEYPLQSIQNIEMGHKD